MGPRSGGVEPRAKRWTVVLRDKVAVCLSGCTAVWAIVRRYPGTALVPLLLLAVLVSLGSWGITVVADREADNNKVLAAAMAHDTAAALYGELVKSYGIMYSVAAIIKYNPSWAFIQDVFPAIAPTLREQVPAGSIDFIALMPNGVLSAVSPADSPAAIAAARPADMFAEPQAARLGLEAVAGGVLTMQGPFQSDAAQKGGIYVGLNLPVFVSNASAGESFGSPRGTMPACAACYNATTRTKIWGFVGSAISLEFLRTSAPLRTLDARGYGYQLLAPGGPIQLIVGQEQLSSSGRRKAVYEVPVAVPNGQWLLRVALGPGSYRPSWYAPVLASFIVAALVVPLLLFAVLLSRRQHQALLEALLPKAMIADLARGAADDGDPASGLDPFQINSDTPADLIVDMMGGLLEGRMPAIRDIVVVRTAIRQAYDINRPVGIGKRIEGAALDAEVVRALMQQLGQADGKDSGTLELARTLRRRTLCATPSQAVLHVPMTGTDDGTADEEEEDADPEEGLMLQARIDLLGGPSGSAAGGGHMMDDDDEEEEDGGLAAQQRSMFQELRGALSLLMMQQQPWGMDQGPRRGSQLQDLADSLESSPLASRAPTRPSAWFTNLQRNGLQAMLSRSGSAVAAAAADSSVHNGLSRTDSGVAFVQGQQSPRTPVVGHLTARRPSLLQPTVLAGRRASSVTNVGTPPPAAAIVEEAERLLSQADSWHFDVFALHEATQGHALSCLGFYLMHRSNLITHFDINPAVLARYLRHIESGYLDNPYHNAIHAADVLRSLHVILHQAQLTAHYVDHLGLLAAYMAAVVHDYGHLGLTNDFLVATKSPLALRYNDRAPMENHHCAAAFVALQRPGLNFLEGVGDKNNISLRKMVIELVLATDMKQHFGIVSHFKTVHRLGTAAPAASAASASGGSWQQTARGTLGAVSQARLNAAASVTAAAQCCKDAPKPADEAERLLGLQVALKAADLGHLTAALPVHKRWLERLEEEFFRQGDKEREAGMPISPLFDRAKQGASKSQVGFYDFVALPLLHSLAAAFPGTRQLLDNGVSNYQYWKTNEDDAKQEAGVP